MHAMEKPAAARIRRSEKQLPPSGMLSARRRRSSQSPAWPAFPTDSNARAGLGMGCGKQSPVASPARNGDGGSPASSSGSFSRKSVGKSSVRKKSSCCDSCRPHKGTKIEYDDVFGGPPKYFASLSKMSAPDYDDIFRRSFSLSPQSGTVRSKSKTEEIPVFSPQEYESADVFEKPTSPAVKIGYEDVFGGPLAGPRTKMLKDLLRCSGFSKAGSRGSTQASSPVSSMHSVCRESHGNPVYEYESEGLGNGKHFNSPRKSSVGGKSPQAYVEVESKRKPAVTSVSASSSPFTEQFDNSTVHSYSTSFTDKVLKVNTGKVCKVSSDEKVSKGDTEGVHKNSVKNAFGDDNESSSSEFEMRYVRRSSPKPRKPRSKGRPSRVRSRLHSPIDTQSSVHNANVGKKEVLQKTYRRVEEPNSSDSDSSPIKESMEVSSTKSGKTDGTSKKESKQVSFITVSHVQLTTEPNASPPARPAPVKGFEVLSEREMSELLEAEAFMEYSIKDLDGLVAEEYVVSHESVSGSSVSTSLKTSPSGRSYEDEDSDHCYAKDAVEGVGDSSEVEKPGTKGEDVSGGDGEDRSGNDKDFTTPEKSAGLDVSKSNLEEILTSSSEHREGISVNASDELSSLCEFEEIEGETSERRKARWERHQRALERVAKALAEKNSRELEHERAQEEKQRVAELLDDVIKRWAAGKQGNLRALLSTLQYILWPECGWKHVSLIDIVEPVCVRKAYRKATLCVHPDKLQQKNASTEHKYIAEKVFDLLQEAWTLFNYEQVF